MNKSERHRTIIRLLQKINEDHLINTRTLAARFEVSEMTIRRDLQELADEGLISRQRGGAAGLQSSNSHSSVSKRIGIVLVSSVQKYTDPFFNVVLEGIDNKLLECGYEIAFIRSYNEVASAELAASLLDAQPVAGIILVGQPVPESIPHIIEHVSLIVSIPDFIGVDYDTIAFDGQYGVQEMIEHLVHLGYRRIGFITGSLDCRSDGYWAGLSAHRLPDDPGMFINVHDWTPEAGEAGASQLMQLPNFPHAIVCASDRLAIGAIQWAHQNGFQVPDDVAIVGFDNITDSAFTVPPLTTVHVHKRSMGILAAKRLVQRIENSDSIPLQITTPTYLVIRESCGAKNVKKNPSFHE